MKNLNFIKQKRLNLPQMNSAINRWAVSLSLVKVSQDIVDGDKVEISETIDLQGVWQPLNGEQLQSKPEGQRSWEWVLLHVQIKDLNPTKVTLSTGDKVLYEQKYYKVMSVKDYGLYGYAEYELCRDYENE